MDQSLRKIVVGVDATELGERALAYALDLAAGRKPTEVHAIRVIEPMVDPLVGAIPSTGDELDALKELLHAAIQREIAGRGVLEVSAVVAHVAIGAPARAIADLAAQLDADLVVVGTHGRRGFKRALLGSVAEEVVRVSGCPVVVVRPKDHPPEAREPQVEPVCPDCAKVRAETNGAQLWCERHLQHRPRAHVYHYEEASVDSVRPWGFHG
ncbi:MAG: universal stress protein [Deltaproteobacteria bacterium]|nr:universal stress protein [Deltaproteobacteria bacterium]